LTTGWYLLHRPTPAVYGCGAREKVIEGFFYTNI